ncbi:type II toxin-antitoxin system antitoxin SocA domain-containing protein [Anaerovoracaceae bacterium 42-11]
MEKTIDVAQYITEKYREITGEAIDEMKLHKLLYFSQRENLALKGEPLFDGVFEGWRYGPVCKEIRSLYDSNDGTINYITGQISDDSAYVINNVIYEYGSLASWKLSELSHRETSWINSRNGLKSSDIGNNELRLEDIKQDAKKVRPYDHVWDMYFDEFEDFEEEK